MAGNSVDELRKAELSGTEDLQKYLTASKDLFRAFKDELDSRADEIQVILEESMPGLDRFSSRMKARKVSRQLKRGGDAAHRGMVHMVRTWMTYKNEYEPKTEKKPKKVWKF